MNEEELYSRIIAKYPQYKDITPAELMPKIYAKHPQYQTAIDGSSGQFKGLSTGGIGYGADLVKRGLSIKDAPNVVAKGVSGFLGGMPEETAKNPMKTAIAGPIGAGVRFGVPKEKKSLPFPRPYTSAGKELGNVAEFTAGAMLPTEAAGGLSKSTDYAGKFGQIGGKNLKTAEELAQELMAQVDEGVKVPGAMQGGYTEANHHELVDADKFKQLLKSFSKPVREAIENDPELERQVINQMKNKTDALGIQTSEAVNGGPEIVNNLKNLERMRKISNGELPSNYFNKANYGYGAPELSGAKADYQNIGTLMTEGRPELSEAMQNYALASKGRTKLKPMLVDQQGYPRAEHIANMLGDKTKSGTKRAIEALAENNPEILQTAEKIRKFGSGIRRTEAVKRFGKYAIPSAVGSAFGFNGIRKWLD